MYYMRDVREGLQEQVQLASVGKYILIQPRDMGRVARSCGVHALARLDFWGVYSGVR